MPASHLLASLRRSFDVMSAIRALSVLTAVGFVAFGLKVLDDSRQDTTNERIRADRGLMRAVAQDVSRNFQSFDLSLQGVIKGLSSPDIDRVLPETRQDILFDYSASATYLDHLVAIDADGVVTDDSSSVKGRGVQVADEPYFRVHVDDADAGLFISRPMISRLSPGVRVLVISRRVSNPDGSFHGVVAGTIDVQFFEALFDNLRLGPRDSFAVIQDDGALVLRHPYRLLDIGADLRGADVFKHYPQSSAGVFESGSSSTDHIPRIFSFTRIGNLPMVLVIGSAESDIYAPWMRKAMMMGGVMLVLSCAMGALGVLLAGELRRREAAERQMRSLADQLAIVAATDSLTGLANRRAFDEVFIKECKRSHRTQFVLSVLMIDVDFFKQYNDALGHTAGDEALRAVADCIATNCRRPADEPARYGGEEFVILLPETPAVGAAHLADLIRQAVWDRNIPHPHGVDGRLTLSIGAASAIPASEKDFAKIIASADLALYRAKEMGRNRCEVIREDPTIRLSIAS